MVGGISRNRVLVGRYGVRRRGECRPKSIPTRLYWLSKGGGEELHAARN